LTPLEAAALHARQEDFDASLAATDFRLILRLNPELTNIGLAVRAAHERGYEST
jgi:hypothetical protein